MERNVCQNRFFDVITCHLEDAHVSRHDRRLGQLQFVMGPEAKTTLLSLLLFGLSDYTLYIKCAQREKQLICMYRLAGCPKRINKIVLLTYKYSLFTQGTNALKRLSAFFVVIPKTILKKLSVFKLVSFNQDHNMLPKVFLSTKHLISFKICSSSTLTNSGYKV